MMTQFLIWYPAIVYMIAGVIAGSFTFIVITGPSWDLPIESLSKEANIAAIWLLAVVSPLLVIVGLVWVLYKAPRPVVQAVKFIGRGGRDLYRAWRPAKVELPKAQVRL